MIFVETKSPPQVETEISHTSFLVWPIQRPHDGFFMLYWTVAMPIDESISLGGIIKLLIYIIPNR